MKQSTNKVAMYYGLLLSLSLIAYDMILWVAGLKEVQSLGYLVYAIITLWLVLAVRKQRDVYQKGFISFGGAYGVTILVAVIAAVVTGIYQYVYLSFIDTGAIDEIMRISQQALLEKGLTDAEIDQAMIMQKKMMTPGLISGIAAFSVVFVTALGGLIIAAVLKKDAPPFDNNDVIDHLTESNNQ